MLDRRCTWTWTACPAQLRSQTPATNTTTDEKQPRCSWAACPSLKAMQIQTRNILDEKSTATEESWALNTTSLYWLPRTLSPFGTRTKASCAAEQLWKTKPVFPKVKLGQDKGHGGAFCRFAEWHRANTPTAPFNVLQLLLHKRASPRSSAWLQQHKLLHLWRAQSILFGWLHAEKDTFTFQHKALNRTKTF